MVLAWKLKIQKWDIFGDFQKVVPNLIGHPVVGGFLFPNTKHYAKKKCFYRV